MRVLLTGGAGYIGTHTAVELINAGHDVVIVDNLANSSAKAVHRVERLTNSKIRFHEQDALDSQAMERIFAAENIDAVIHFAGLKAVGESVADPLSYYHININSALTLVRVMLSHGVNNLVFSSSATVYGEPERVPIDETCAVHDAANPYGRTKLMIERILEDVAFAYQQMNIVRLRYFNPAGAHSSGEIGEDPRGTPSNLLPFVTQVAIGRREELVVFGDDYPTTDGTCVRDYIHVVDLAKGHVAALERLHDNPGLVTCNLGTGTGYSVLDIIHAFERSNGLKVPFSIGPRRAGDIPSSFTNPSLAASELGWRAEKNLDDICRDAWNWQQRNPQGYGD